MAVSLKNVGINVVSKTISPTPIGVDLSLRVMSSNAKLGDLQIRRFYSYSEAADFFGSTSEEAQRARSYFATRTEGVAEGPRAISFAYYSVATSSGIAYTGSTALNFTPAGIPNITESNKGIAIRITLNTLTNRASAFVYLDTTYSTLTSVSSFNAVLSNLTFGILAQLRTAGFGASSNLTMSVDPTSQKLIINVSSRPNGTAFIGDNGVLTLTAEFGSVLDNTFTPLSDPSQAKFGTVTPEITPSSVSGTTPWYYVEKSIQQDAGLGSVIFAGSALTAAQNTAVAQGMAALDIGGFFALPVTIVNAEALWLLMSAVNGTVATLSPPQTNLSNLQFPEQFMVSVAAAIDFTAPNSVLGFKFRSVGDLSASVDTDANNTFYGGLQINRVVSTTNLAAQTLDKFLVDGSVWGDNTYPSEFGVAVNDLWLRRAFLYAWYKLVRDSPNLGANTSGLNALYAAAQTVIGQALFSGIISVGKTLDAVQIAKVQQITAPLGAPNAYVDISTKGYWLYITITSTISPSGNIEYKATPYFLYAANNQVRQISQLNVALT